MLDLVGNPEDRFTRDAAQTFFLFQTTPATHVMTYRELKFQQFASVQYEGIIYMTPQDFLESVTEDSPRRKFLVG